MSRLIPAFIVLLLLGLLMAMPSPDAAAAPKKAADDNEGIAAKYPMDQDIMKDPKVIFWDDFERADFKRWDENQVPRTTKLTAAEANVYSGKQAVEMTAIVPETTGGGLIKWFAPGVDKMHARFYVKFAKDVNYVHHFVHIVGGRDKWSGFGKAGTRPNGTDFFTTGIEPDAMGRRFGPPGAWHFYTYWPDMKGSPGRYWGNNFSPPEPIPIPRDTWICVEIMLKANSAPDKYDGEQAFCINGKLAGRYGNFRWRTTNDLKVNAFWLLYYVTTEALRRNNTGKISGSYTVWFDDVVVATDYIGPMNKGAKKTTGGSGGKVGGKFTPPPGF